MCNSPISAAKVCDCAHGVDRYVMSCLIAVSPKWSVPGINIVSSVFSLVGRSLEKTTLDSEKFHLVLAGSNGIKP